MSQTTNEIFIGEYTLLDVAVLPSSERPVVSLRARDAFGKAVRICRLHKSTGNFEPKEYIKRAKRFCDTPHPSTLRVVAQVQDPESAGELAVIYDSYEEDLASFITRRRTHGQFLTSGELLYVYRQLVAALAVWYSPGIVHRAICPGNVLISRNGQNQLVFKIADLHINDNTHLAPEQPHNKIGDARSDMYAVGLLLYEIATLSLFTPASLTANKSQMRTDLESKESPLRTRYGYVYSALEVVLQMVDDDAARRPVPKYVQIALAAIALLGTFAVYDCIV